MWVSDPLLLEEYHCNCNYPPIKNPPAMQETLVRFLGQEDPLEKVVQLVKDPPTMRETWVPSLAWEDPLEMGKATHYSSLAWTIPWAV